MNDVTSLVGLAEIAGVVVLAILYIKSKIPKETIDQQTKLIDALEKRITNLESDAKELHAQHVENEKTIADLQGQIKVYKELPLQDIAKSLKALERIPHEFQKVSEKSTEQILNAVTNVRTQHVTHQTVDTETVKHKS